MQITIEDISPVEKRVEFEVPWGDVAPKLDRAYSDLRRKVQLKGFRPGKVPRSLIEKLYKHEVERDVAHELVEMSMGQAISENQLQPVAPATVDKIEIKTGEPFRFTARVEVRSLVTPKDYTGITLKRRPPKVTDEDVGNAIERHRRQLTEYRPVEGRATTADTDLLAVEVHGRIGEHKVKKHSLVVDLADDNAGGVPGLAARLRGAPVNAQHLEVKYRIPDDAPVKGLQGKDVSLHVTIVEARERRQPALDDELAKDTGLADTLEELRHKVRERLIESDREQITRELKLQVVKELVARNPFPIAPALVERHAEVIVARTRAQLAMMGIGVEGEDLDVAKMKEEFRAEAEQEARAGALIHAIAEREGISVGDADVQKRIAELAAARQENAKKLRGELERGGRIEGLRAQLLEDKTLDMLLGQAKITDEDPERLILTPEEATGQRLIMTPEQARAEAQANATQGRNPRK